MRTSWRWWAVGLLAAAIFTLTLFSALILRRFGGFRQAEVMRMTWPQVCEEVQEVLDFERELNRA